MRRRATKNLLAGLLLWAVLLVPGRASGEEGCGVSLQTAAEQFEQGKLEGARGALESCLASIPTRIERSRALSLLAKIHLATDDLPAAEATLGRLLDADADFQADIFDSPRFVRLVALVRSRKSTPTVTSVSKSKEPLAEAPATVLVVTGAEIERRGYTDLEAVLRDMPGFDFSRRAGASYSNIYQRGYRSIETNRTMLLIDGVEDNDLASSTAWISRQFPLSNVDRIEVVYGPASTMYGANAFAGVINVITKSPESIIDDGNLVGGDVRLMASKDAGYVDAVVAGQSSTGSVRWSLTARRYDGDDLPDLDDYPQWDYDPAAYDAVDYTKVSGLNPTNPATIAAILAKYTPEQLAPYFTVVTDAAGNATAIKLTPEGAERARGLDQSAYDQVVSGGRVRYRSPVEDWMVDAKLSLPNLIFGLQTWRQQESSNIPLVDTFAAPGKNGFLWTPEHTSAYMKYFGKYLDGKMSMQLFLQYKEHSLDGTDSANVYLRNYQLGSLKVAELVEDRKPYWDTQYNYRSNNQIRTELNLFYEHSDTLNAVGGLEVRYSSVGANNITSSTAPADETGTPPTGVLGGNQISSRDLGAYMQGSWRPWAPLKIVAGGRLDNNKIRQSGGFGTVFNPRLVAVYDWRKMVFKAMYSTAFQDAPNFQKYEKTATRLLNNPTLAPEKVKNFELSAAWNPFAELSFQVGAYRSEFEGIVQEVSGVPCSTCSTSTTNQFQNVGRLEIQGIQAEGHWNPGPFRLLANYTWTDPMDPDKNQRVGDIASHRANLLGGTSFFRDRLDAELRVNGVWGRETGKGTTVSNNPYSKIDDYVIAAAALTWRKLLPGFDLQLAVENLLDEEYWDPSLRNPSGFPIAAQIPQPGRTFFLRLRVTR